MKAIVYTRTGASSVLELVDRDPIDPSPGEVRVRVAVSGVNPTDWKSRAAGRRFDTEAVPNQDGAGTIDAIGPGVDRFGVGDRVWMWDVAQGTTTGTAQELVTLPARNVMPLPAAESFDAGASLGIPALTAHLALSPHAALAPGALAGVPILVTGGAGAVGHAAIQLAAWAGARVITTVSGPEKAALATAAGAHHVINYREESIPDAVRAIAPEGVPRVVDVSITHNIADDLRCIAVGGTVVAYADDGDPEFPVPIRPAMGLNARIRFLLTYTVSTEEKDAALAGVQAALAAGALRVGEEHGMPLTRFPLARTGAAHDAVEAGTVGKVLIDVR